MTFLLDLSINPFPGGGKALSGTMNSSTTSGAGTSGLTTLANLALLNL